jgi:hypothetical protein
MRGSSDADEGPDVAARHITTPRMGGADPNVDWIVAKRPGVAGRSQDGRQHKQPRQDNQNYNGEVQQVLFAL